MRKLSLLILFLFTSLCCGMQPPKRVSPSPSERTKVELLDKTLGALMFFEGLVNFSLEPYARKQQGEVPGFEQLKLMLPGLFKMVLPPHLKHLGESFDIPVAFKLLDPIEGYITQLLEELIELPNVTDEEKEYLQTIGYQLGHLRFLLELVKDKPEIVYPAMSLFFSAQNQNSGYFLTMGSLQELLGNLERASLFYLSAANHGSHEAQLRLKMLAALLRPSSKK